MEMGGTFCQILELGGGTTIKGRRVRAMKEQNNIFSTNISAGGEPRPFLTITVTKL